MVAIISGKSALFPYPPIVDKYTWGFLMVRKIYHDFIVQSQSKGEVLSEKKMIVLLKFIDKIPNRLSLNIPGNHFLFVGKKGARSVANCLDKFDGEIEQIKAEQGGYDRHQPDAGDMAFALQGGFNFSHNCWFFCPKVSEGRSDALRPWWRSPRRRRPVLRRRQEGKFLQSLCHL